MAETIVSCRFQAAMIYCSRVTQHGRPSSQTQLSEMPSRGFFALFAGCRDGPAQILSLSPSLAFCRRLRLAFFELQLLHL